MFLMKNESYHSYYLCMYLKRLSFVREVLESILCRYLGGPPPTIEDKHSCFLTANPTVHIFI